MNTSKITFAVITALSAGASYDALAIDLYVDTKTKQIYAEPGPNREKMGSFVRVEDAEPEAKPATTADTKELSAIRGELATKSMEIKALQEHMTEAEKVKVKLDNKGIGFESADKKFKFKLGGRIHADASFHGGDPYFEDGESVEAEEGTEIRRARMRFEGVFFKDWLFRTEADFADDNVRMKDVYLQYLGSKFVTITAGQQKQNFSRELQESSNDMMFTERSLMNILNAPIVDRAIGLDFEHFSDNFTAKLGFYGDSISPPDEQDPTGDEGWGISSRIIYSPVNEKNKLIHLGVAGNYREPDDNQEVAKGKKLRYVYETTNMSSLNVIDQKVNNVNDIKMLGLEAAGMYGPYSIGAEYTRTWIDCSASCDGATSKSNIQLDGWYAEAAWSITGESRKYQYGNFRYLEPSKPFNPGAGGWGAWELAMRYSAADLNDGGFLGGEISNITAAINWYINTNFRFQANYMHVLDTDNAALTQPDGGDIDDLDVFMLRGQVAF